MTDLEKQGQEPKKRWQQLTRHFVRLEYARTRPGVRD